MATQAQPVHTTVGTDFQEIKIVSHSTLLYWWPVWAFGFVLALLTWMDGHYMVLVPKGTHAEQNRVVQDIENGEPRDVYVLPKGRHVSVDAQTGVALQS